MQMSLQLGILFQELGDPTGLETRLLRLEKKTNFNITERFALASAWIDPLKNFERGMELLTPLAEEDASGQIRFETGLLLEDTGRPDLALEEMRRYRLDHPSSKEGFFLFIRLLDGLGKQGEALTELASWIKSHPDDITSQRLRDDITRRQGANL
jgi:hypothetical protein